MLWTNLSLYICLGAVFNECSDDFDITGFSRKMDWLVLSASFRFHIGSSVDEQFDDFWVFQSEGYVQGGCMFLNRAVNK